MASERKDSKIWIRFEGKKKNGETIKLRIQDLPEDRMEDYVKFYLTYFIKDEAFHKATGIYNCPESLEEYKTLFTSMMDMQRPEIAICCLDDDSEDSNKILAVSTVQLASSEVSLEDFFKEMGIEFKTPGLQAMGQVMAAMQPKFPKSLKQKYKNYHEGRGIIVHPDYRGLGIASQIVKQRRLLIKEHNVPMTYAWMTSLGSQKAAERDGWETVSEISPEEMDELTGLFFEKTVPTYKMMIATLES